MNERYRIKEVAVAVCEDTGSYIALLNEFSYDLEKWGADIDRSSLILNFTAPDVPFAVVKTLSSKMLMLTLDF